MLSERRGLLVEASTVVRSGFPDWIQGLPARTPAELAAYGLGFLKLLIQNKPGFFLDDAYKPQFEALLDTAIQHFTTNNIPQGLIQVETIILPKINEWVLPGNRVPFRQIVDFAVHGVRFSGVYYFTPTLEEIMEGPGEVVECTRIQVTYHIEGIEDPLFRRFNCQYIEGTVHVVTITPPSDTT